MTGIKLLRNPVQHYAWGSYTSIPTLLGQKSPADRPFAELWMGAHPKSPSLVIEQGQKIPLNEWIETDPGKILGKTTVNKFGRTFPFLFKVLAAEEPLSIQAHPDKEQARQGFERENRAGIPVDDPARNYRDANHKPECICALTPFSGLYGFRPVADICSLLSRLLPGQAEGIIAPLKDGQTETGCKNFFLGLLSLDKERAAVLVKLAADQAGRLETDPAMAWIVRLQRRRPEDIMALAPAFLNYFELSPQEALFLPAGVLHAYLNGTGIELMANSDNVLRGGLTDKHIDVDELAAVLCFSKTEPQRIVPEAVSDCETLYRTEAEEFTLAMIKVVSGRSCRVDGGGKVRILLCTEGSGVIVETGSRNATPFRQGDALLLPASVGSCLIDGKAEIYKASGP